MVSYCSGHQSSRLTLIVSISPDPGAHLLSTHWCPAGGQGRHLMIGALNPASAFNSTCSLPGSQSAAPIIGPAPTLYPAPHSWGRLNDRRVRLVNGQRFDRA